MKKLLVILCLFVGLSVYGALAPSQRVTSLIIDRTQYFTPTNTGAATNIVLDLSGPKYAICTPSNTATISFVNLPTGTGEVMEIEFRCTNSTLNLFWTGIDTRGRAPGLVQGKTNTFTIKVSTSPPLVNDGQDILSGDITAAIPTTNGPTINNLNEIGTTTAAAITVSGATILANVQPTSIDLKSGGSDPWIKPGATNNVPTTNVVGQVDIAFTSVITCDFGQSSDFNVTNRVTAAASVIWTNSLNRPEGSVFILGEVSGGTSRVMTLIPETGTLVFNEDIYGTALATSYAFTLTNGNAVEIRGSKRRLNGTNILAVVTRQGSF